MGISAATKAHMPKAYPSFLSHRGEKDELGLRDEDLEPGGEPIGASERAE